MPKWHLKHDNSGSLFEFKEILEFHFHFVSNRTYDQIGEEGGE